MFCPNCGKEVNEKAVVCVNCGVPLNNNYNKFNKPKKGKGIASMILGILAVVYCFSAFAAFEDIPLTLKLYSDTLANKIAFTIGFIMFQSIFAIISICLAIAERKQNKNGFNTAGLWLSLVSFACIAIQTIYIITI